MRFGALLLLTTLLFLFACKKQNTLNALSDASVTMFSYTDTLEKGGRSKIELFDRSDSSAAVSFRLLPGYSYPYAGVAFRKSDSSLIDLSEFDSLHLSLRANRPMRLKVYTKTLGANFDTTIYNDRYRRKFIDIKEGNNTINLSLKELIEPNWWLRETNANQTDLPTENYAQVVSFGINTTTLLNQDIPYSLTIDKFKFTPHNEHSMTLQFALIYGAGFLVFFLIYRKSHSSEKPKARKTGHLSIRYDELHQIEETIKQNLSIESFSSVDIAQMTSLDIKLVIETIKEHYGVTVKQHINTLRVAHAKVLLRDSQLTFEEISLRCGYRNSDDFKQLFVAICGENPGSYRVHGRS